MNDYFEDSGFDYFDYYDYFDDDDREERERLLPRRRLLPLLPVILLLDLSLAELIMLKSPPQMVGIRSLASRGFISSMKRRLSWSF